MRDLWGDLRPERQQFYEQHLNMIIQSWKDNRDCFACRFCRDISDERNTCHLCKYTNDLLPEEHTCLLWDLKEDEEEDVQ